MCGLAGFLAFHRSPYSAEERQAILRNMGRAIAHRGPDDEQFYDDGALSIVFRRLSVIDLEGGRQPIFNENRDALIVANGEIYNQRALREKLRENHRFTTHSDTETALHLIEEQGIAGLSQLTGMFALAYWDIRERKLLLARDRLGIKPLYVCALPDGILFASELKALLCHPHCPRDLDWSALDFARSQQRTPVVSYVRGVEFLAGGEWLEAGADGRWRKGTYWHIAHHLGAAPFGNDRQAYIENYAALLDEVTGDHLQSDVPLALHLSGGIDSSLLAALVARRRHDVSCFTVVERTTWQCGDVDSAGRMARALDLPWHPVLFDYRTLLDQLGFDLTRLEQLVWMMDAPRFDLEWLFKQELHRYAHTVQPQMKVVLIGQGADEFAGGYSRSLAFPRQSWPEYLQQEVLPDLRMHHGHDAQVPAYLQSLYAPPAIGAGRTPYHEKMRLLTYQLQHFNLWHEDRTSSSLGLEARVPFLDHRLVELLASVPDELQPELFWDKRIVREATARALPAYDLTRPKVGFFATDDMRTINLLMHGIAARVALDFREKYYDDPHFPLDRAVLDGLIGAVLRREGDFYLASWRVIECMTIAIFARQCREPVRHAPEPLRERESRLGAFNELSDELRAAFAGEPVASVQWSLDDRPMLPPGTEVLKSAARAGTEKIVLVQGLQVRSQVEVPITHPWLARFLVELADQPALTVRDWMAECVEEEGEFIETLNALLQGGFIARAG